MTTPQEQAAQIAQAATEPRSTTADGVSITDHSLPDRIAAAKFVASTMAFSGGLGGIRRVKLAPGGPTT